MADRERQDALLALLNSTPAVDGVGGAADEPRSLTQARDALRAVVRGDRPAASLAPLLDGVTSHPDVSPTGVSWQVEAPAGRREAVEAVLTWSAVQQALPGRLRPCANPECGLFLLDRSKANKARWCSMAVCGNRMKARRHLERAREAAAE
ncbi:CGNR zinc finger domain-containing protein [Streptomyces sp. NPDC101225]|uniref:CGNR zinc finger domain-containing protein n=1 Tax=Streptomyces sp. NPDC101225 TaxID=3366135 RepID=UPI00380CBC23